jgi:Eukaryotic cytochrome b561
MIDWLITPLSGALTHSLAPMTAWHARCMVLAWGVLVPVGILVARYWKIWPGQAWPFELDNKMWWHLHRMVQSAALVLMSLGAWLMWSNKSDVQADLGLHGVLGWAVLGAAWLQVLGALLRGTKGGPTDTLMEGDHYLMTAHRRRFEWLHKSLGWGSLALAMVTIVLGLIQADAPRWMVVMIFFWWCALAALAWRWQRQNKCIDTYQAIWGNKISLPGMAHLPVGWGIHRVDHDSSKHI